jgi:ABC-type Fe3+/spermidine/putrescine transport system ATPase subunit
VSRPEPLDRSSPERGLVVRGLRKAYGATRAVDGVDFEARPGEVVALLGPSGCGKSTVLLLVAGLEPPDGGEMRWDGRGLAGVPPERRGFGLMFQDYALFPHRSVLDNVTFGPRMAGVPAARARSAASALLARLGLAGFEDRDVTTLSGGEQQRVALARALAPQPALLMLDEPLGALDRALAERLLVDLRGLLAAEGRAALYVTHDQAEAFAIADRIVLLRAGRVVQTGSPRALYGAPASAWVAAFLGLGNLVEGVVPPAPGGTATVAETAIGRVPLAGGPGSAVPGGPVTVLLRPEGARLLGPGEPPAPGEWLLEGQVVDRTFQGAREQLTLAVGPERLRFELPAASTARAGQRGDGWLRLALREPAEALPGEVSPAGAVP